MSGRSNSIGRHLPTSGGLKRTLERAAQLGCEALQIFVSNPQGWAPPPERPDAGVLARGKLGAGLCPVVAHAKYLINLSSPDGELRERSVRALAAELVAAGRLGADLVVVHAGSHGGEGEERGMERLARGLDAARGLAASLGGRAAEPVVENSCGAGTQLCSSFAALGRLARLAGVRVCVDTAHAFVAGYDLSTPEGAAGVAGELGEHLDGRVALLHLNDARNGLGSRRDGHAKVGEGRIPPGSFAALFAALPGLPAVMETPYGTPEEDAREIERVKELAGGLRGSPGGI
ncbi:Endonuclease IV [Rubrobacter xylanophilus DSM 9941]|uniref:Endonuclease IV n=1 Tax=Rubrobacter xylanophilus (strain DSM 9941 / JCM 11954 / NBRC 16129 / PRD-1) TaxID=266117 RepID=Q1AWW5_RUBXD|nr:deoxyribonuclease IV [Rubrobacter xylanophilus]ABG04113.1 Endonuclease IV [Rubrobacter xylanophilus DSM 9941]